MFGPKTKQAVRQEQINALVHAFKLLVVDFSSGHYAAEFQSQMIDVKSLKKFFKTMNASSSDAYDSDNYRMISWICYVATRSGKTLLTFDELLDYAGHYQKHIDEEE